MGLWLLVSCQSQPTVTPEKADRPETTATNDRAVDPLELPRDREIIPVKHPVAGDVAGRVALIEADKDTTFQPTVIVPGDIDSLASQAFRVQLLTSQVYGEAKSAVRVAEEIFDRPVFLDYEVPYYKVRVGNFGNRDKAEEYRLRAEAAGYTDAWVVAVTVNVKQTSLLYEPASNPVESDTSAIDTAGIR